MKKNLELDDIKKLLPHREPMLLIEKISNIVSMESATGHINVDSNKFFFDGHFPGQPVFPGVLVVEAFGQTAAALSASNASVRVYTGTSRTVTPILENQERAASTDF